MDFKLRAQIACVTHSRSSSKLIVDSFSSLGFVLMKENYQRERDQIEYVIWLNV